MTDAGKVPPIKRAVILAGSLLSLTAALKLCSPDYINAELARRLVGIVMGCIVVLYANLVPKQLRPLAVLRGSPAKEQAIRRFTGISLVLGGVGFALAWMFVPIAAANVVAASLLGSALVVVIIRYGLLFAGRPQD